MYSQKNQGIHYNFVIPFSDSDPVEINIEAEEADASDTESPGGDNKVGRDWEEDIDDFERLSRNTTINLTGSFFSLQPLLLERCLR